MLLLPDERGRANDDDDDDDDKDESLRQLDNAREVSDPGGLSLAPADPLVVLPREGGGRSPSLGGAREQVSERLRHLDIRRAR